MEKYFCGFGKDILSFQYYCSCLCFFALRFWLKLEIERQRQQIYSEYSQNIEPKEREDLKNLLSVREVEVLELITKGLSNKEIAEKTIYIIIHCKDTYQ
jgi:hypothetical protein